jgi:hypothetical protein
VLKSERDLTDGLLAASNGGNTAYHIDAIMAASIQTNDVLPSKPAMVMLGYQKNLLVLLALWLPREVGCNPKLRSLQALATMLQK